MNLTDWEKQRLAFIIKEAKRGGPVYLGKGDAEIFQKLLNYVKEPASSEKNTTDV